MRYSSIGPIFIAMCALGALASCAAKKQSVDPGDSQVVKERYQVYETFVSIIVLEDGTRCAVSDGYYSGGIDCEWKQ